jgi:FMN-dependent NADH-azoreductase
MTTLLRIDASAREVGSFSRQLGDHFVAAWQQKAMDAVVVMRDLITTPIPHISNDTIGGFYTPADQMTAAQRAATALSDTLIAEVMAADAILVTTPMYNFSAPSALKAWIDQIVRINHSFAYDGQNFTGLITGKPVYIACAYGASGYTDNGPMAAYDLLQGYLRLLFGFLGFTDIHFVGVEATTAATDVAAEALRRALQLIDQLAGAL